MNGSPVLYEERQRFTQPWLWATMLLACAGVVMVLVSQRLHEAKTLSALAPHVASLVIGFAVIVLVMRFTGLNTEVCTDGLHIRFAGLPFAKWHFPFERIATHEAVTYRPIRDFGGWGIKGSRKKGRALTVSGNRGVQLVLTNGKRWLIGSQDPEALDQSLAKALGARNRHGSRP
jgi:hypothetical protein